MDFLSDSEGQQPNSSQRDLQRLQKLHASWINVKERRQSDKKSVNSVKNAIHQQQQKNLQARLAMTEKQLSKARENTALLMKKLSEAEEELQVKQFELNREKNIREERQEQIEELKVLLGKRNQEVQEGTFGMNKENSCDNFQIDSLKKTLEIKQKEIDRLCLKVKSLELDQNKYDDELKNLQETNEEYRKKLTASENAMNEAYLGEPIKGAQLLQLKEAKKIIERLIILLSKTDEYRNFTEFLDDSKLVHFLKNIPRRLKTNGLNHRIPDKTKLCTCMDIKIDERLLWTPEAAYRALLEMKIKYGSLNEECIEETLFQLNKIWLARQESHIRKIKESHECEIGKLKKKTEQRYDEMVARKQIQRLKKELSQARGCCISSQNNFRKCSHKGTVNLMDNLKNVGQYQDEIRIKQKEIGLLQERIRLLENQSDSSDRALYLEGALWVIEKILKELDHNDEDMRQFENQFRQKIQSNISNDEWLRSFKQFFETISQVNNSLAQRLFSMRDSTLKRITAEKVYPNESSVRQ